MWARQLGGASSEVVEDLAVNASGTIAVGGRFTGTIQIGDELIENWDPDGNKSDIFLATLDPDGGPTWGTSLATDDIDDIASIGFDQSGRLIVGSRMDDRPALHLFEGATSTWQWSPPEPSYSTPKFGFSANGSVLYGPWSVVKAIDLGGGTLGPHGGDDMLIAKFSP